MRVLFILSAICLAAAFATEPEKKDETELDKAENDPGIGYGPPRHKICYGMKCRRVPRKKCAVRKQRIRGRPRCTMKTKCGHDPHGYGDEYGYGYNCKKVKVCSKPVYRIRRRRHCWRIHKKICRKVRKRCGYGGYEGGHGKICYGNRCRRVRVGKRCFHKRVKKCGRKRCMWKTQCGHDGGYNVWGYGQSCKNVKVCHRPRCYWRRKRVCGPKYRRRCYKVPKKCPYYPGAHKPHYPGHGKICYGKKCRRVRVGKKCIMRRRKDCRRKRCVWQTKCGHDGGYGGDDYGYGYNCKKVKVCRPHCIWRRKRICRPKYGKRCYKVPKKCPYYPGGHGPHHPRHGKLCYGKKCGRVRVGRKCTMRRRKDCRRKRCVWQTKCGHDGGYGGDDYGHGYNCKKVKVCRPHCIWRRKRTCRPKYGRRCYKVPKKCPYYPTGYGPHRGGHKKPAYGKKCYRKVCRLRRRRVRKLIIVKRRRKICGFKKVKSYHCGYHQYRQGGYNHGYGHRPSCYKKVKRCRNKMVRTPKAVWRIRKRKVCRRVPKRCPHYY